MFFFISTFDSIPPLCLTSSNCRSFFIPPFCGWTGECISPFHGGSARTLSTLREWGGNEPTDCTPLLTVIGENTGSAVCIKYTTNCLLSRKGGRITKGKRSGRRQKKGTRCRITAVLICISFKKLNF